MRRLLLAASIVVLAATPAEAKGPAITWETSPARPTAGETAQIVMRMWGWTRAGEPDLTSPWTHRVFGMRHAIEFEGIHLYPAAAFPQRGADRIGVPVGAMRRVDRSTYTTTFTFPRPGPWVIAERNPHSTFMPDWLLAEFEVVPRDSTVVAAAVPSENPESGYGTDARPIAAAAAMGALIVAEAAAQRRRREER